MSMTPEQEAAADKLIKDVELRMDNRRYDLAVKLEEQVRRTLLSRYFWVAMIIAILSPVLGFILGLGLEQKLVSLFLQHKVDELSATITESKSSLEATKSNLDEAIAGAKQTKAALDTFVNLSGGKALEQVQRQLTDNKKAIDEADSELKKQSASLKVIAPDLASFAQNLRSTEEAARQVAELQKLLKDDSIQALTAAFFRIYDLRTQKFEVRLLAKKNSNSDAITKKDIRVKARVRFADDGPNSPKTSLEWSEVSLTIRVEDMPQSDWFNPGPEAQKVVVISFDEMKNFPEWWMPMSTVDGKALADSTERMKEIDVQKLERFSIVALELDLTPPTPAQPELASILENLGKVFQYAKFPQIRDGESESYIVKNVGMTMVINGKKCVFSDDNTIKEANKQPHLKPKTFGVHVDPVQSKDDKGNVTTLPMWTIQLSSNELFALATHKYTKAFLIERSQ